MLPALSLCIIALAVSLDGFGVGVMYGLRKIRIPFASILIISCCSGIIIFGSMQIGLLLSQMVSPFTAKAAGACILVVIGIWAVIQMMLQKNEEKEQHLPVLLTKMQTETQTIMEVEPSSNNIGTVVQIKLRRLGLIVQILKTPSIADVDRSGIISASEAALLGVALSLDAFGAGIGAALIGFSPMWTSGVIAIASGIFITLGLQAGYLLSEIKWVRSLSILPGCILIFIGIMKLF